MYASDGGILSASTALLVSPYWFFQAWAVFTPPLIMSVTTLIPSAVQLAILASS